VVAVADTLDSVPLAVRPFGVARTANVETVIPLGILGEPVEAANSLEILALASFPPGNPTVRVGLLGDLGAESRGNQRTVRCISTNQQQIAGCALKNVAFYGRHERAAAVVAVAVGTNRVQENA